MADSARLPVLDGDDIAYEPTVRAEFSFGEWTMPLRSGGNTRPLRPVPVPVPVPRQSPSPQAPTRTADDARLVSIISPPHSATRALGMGLAIGASVGFSLVALAWNFLL